MTCTTCTSSTTCSAYSSSNGPWSGRRQARRQPETILAIFSCGVAAGANSVHSPRAEQEEAIKAEQHPLLPFSQTTSKYYLTLFRTADRMSASSRRDEHQQAYLRQATILRKNLMEWDETIRSPQGANWPSMLGRLNAAMVSCTVGVRCWRYWCG